MQTIQIRKFGPGFVLSYNDIEIGLDTGLQGHVTLLSHAHADHITNLGLANQVVATDATIDTFRARGGRVSWKHIPLNYGERLDLPGVRVQALNAGHVLGSTMFLLIYDNGMRVLYTGDYNTEDSIVHTAAQPVHADVLITETTYGSPRWVFPERSEIHKRITERVITTIEEGRIPILNAYSLGKAQEAIALLQRQKITTVTGNYTIERVNNAYSKYGVAIKNVPIDSDEFRDHIESGCAIVSSQPYQTIRRAENLASLGRYELANRSQIINLTGWALHDFIGNDIPLSAHCDFHELIAFIKGVDARIVYCFTGYANEFSGHLADIGINAIPLE